jgi:hypothetical protein
MSKGMVNTNIPKQLLDLPNDILDIVDKLANLKLAEKNWVESLNVVGGDASIFVDGRHAKRLYEAYVNLRQSPDGDRHAQRWFKNHEEEPWFKTWTTEVNERKDIGGGRRRKSTKLRKSLKRKSTKRKSLKRKSTRKKLSRRRR